MWNKPKEVVPEHRWRARIVWGSLLVSIAAYTSWQAYKMYDGFDHPATSLEVTHETFEYPYLSVCFYPNEGCDEESDCAASALELAQVTGLAGVELPEVNVEIPGPPLDHCIGFDLAGLNLVDSGVDPDETDIILSTVWLLSETASSDSLYFNHVIVLTSDGPPTENDYTFVYVPYTRLLPGTDVVVTATVAELTIGKTTKQDLDGDVETTYPALDIMSTDYAYDSPFSTSTDDGDLDLAFGNLMILLRQGAFSRTSVKEIRCEGHKPAGPG